MTTQSASARRGRRAAFGLLLVASALVAGPLAARFVLLGGEAVDSLEVVFGREIDDARMRAGSEADRWIETVVVDVPRRIALGDQGVLRLEYGVVLQRGETRIDLAELGQPVRLGAAVRTGPSLIVVPPAELADGPVAAPPPLRLSWLIEPQSLGSKRLLLDLELDLGLHAEASADGGALGDAAAAAEFVVRRRSLSINGVSREAPAGEALPLEILAVTRFGLSQQAFTLLRLVASGLGFVLSYPLLVELGKRWLPRLAPASDASASGESRSGDGPDGAPST